MHAASGQAVAVQLHFAGEGGDGADFGGAGEHPQIFAGQLELGAIGEADGQQP